jgi:histidinol-phosphate aminotransferase
MGISYPSVFAAMAAMDDIEFLDRSRALNAACREYVYQSLDAMGIAYVPSHTSFMIFPIEMEGKDFLQKMTDLKVGVRAFNFMGKNWCRVSMGTMEEMKIFTSALKDVIA